MQPDKQDEDIEEFDDHSGFFTPGGAVAVTRHQDLCHWHQNKVFVFVT